ncbi:DnaB-like helicase C-terminal domain-containing protein [Methylobacterium sp. B1]|uniref:replicative DNA helicase n=1 Tax=Methylobacterium sp. B1 TaxID=91459 RepID=UPI0003450658|nr:DnaB-like helicase C-terminal domain-containing protein [Methylobacterium sp. B1]
MSWDNEKVVAFRPTDSKALERLPHCFDTERALLAALLLKPDQLTEVAQGLKVDDLFGAEHREVYGTMLALSAGGLPVSAVTVAQYLKTREIAGQPPARYLASLAADAASWDAPGHAKIVREFARRRSLVMIGEGLAEQARQGGAADQAGTLIDETDTALLEVRGTGSDGRMSGQDAAQATAWMRERIEGLRSGLLRSTAVSTGIADLDRATNGGFQRGQLWLLAGRPGMGKTVAMTSLSRFAARNAGVLVFQCEVTRDQQIARYLADLSYLHNRPLTFGKIMAAVDLTDDEMWRIDEAMQRYERLQLKLECEPGVSVAQIAAAVKAEKRRLAKIGQELGVVFIDYLKFIKVSDRYQGNRVLEIGEISGSLKQLAKAEDVCVVLLTQLNRDVEHKDRKNNRPRLSDLRDSGELEQDADAVLMLYREAYYLAEKVKLSPHDPELCSRLIDKQNALELLLTKNRAGPTPTLDLWCDVASSAIAQTTRGPQ